MALTKEDIDQIVEAAKANTEEIKAAAMAAAKEAIHVELGQYKVDKELHYKHHLFLNDIIEWTNNIKSTVVKTVVKVIITFSLLALFIGFLVLVGQKIK